MPTDLICQRHLLNKAMSCPRKVSTKPQEKEGPRSRSSPKHMAVNERGHSEAQDGGHPSFSVFLQTVPFHAAPHPPPACQRGRSTRSERSSVTSSQGFRPSSGHYLALPPNMLFRTRGQHGVGEGKSALPGAQVPSVRARFWAPQFTGCGVLPWVSHLADGEDGGAYLLGSSRGLTEPMHTKGAESRHDPHQEPEM